MRSGKKTRALRTPARMETLVTDSNGGVSRQNFFGKEGAASFRQIGMGEKIKSWTLYNKINSACQEKRIRSFEYIKISHAGMGAARGLVANVGLSRFHIKALTALARLRLLNVLFSTPRRLEIIFDL